MKPRQFPCSSCGATLHFAPGKDALECPYCGARNDVPEVDTAVAQRATEELDYQTHVAELATQEETIQVQVVKCTNCGAETSFDEKVTADECAFCGTAIVTSPSAETIIRPRALLPFKVTDREGHDLFREWIDGLWFAPNDLKKRARRDEKLAGMYLPHWTYDTDTTTPWRGQRGEHYYETETYVEDGETRTRRVRKTRWYPASGTLEHFFDDVVIPASDSLPRTYMQKLEPWDLDNLEPYSEAYLSGFRSERYSVDLEQGWSHARDRIDVEIDQRIRQQIGGDEQRITWKNTRYDDITFKHILLPVWISAYRYNDDVYRFLVNARTGEVQGERPWSWIKIALAVLAALIVLAIIWYVGGG
jgi:DNA-directed RNA polymerase subunit RPC12/RpoP